MLNRLSPKGFTLIEMLIVIVIIGILAAALIPRLTGIQARARDTARVADMRNASTALEAYKYDKGSYPLAIYTLNTMTPSLLSLVVPTTLAQSAGSSLDKIPLLASYMTLPQDPGSVGTQSSSDGTCLSQGKSYAYYSDMSGSLYSITSAKESKKGNASSCGDTIDRNADGVYEKVGKGLVTNLSTYPPSYQWTAESCFVFSAGTISSYSTTCPKDVVIPEIINGVSVTALAPGIFSNRNLTSVTIPTSITTIGHRVFQYNLLTSVNIPNSVTSIGGAAFADNNLASITLSHSLTSLAYETFQNNKITSVVIPPSITSIDVRAFRSNKLTSVVIPPSVISLGLATFNGNGINSNSSDIIGFSPSGTSQTRNIVGTAWVKQ